MESKIADNTLLFTFSERLDTLSSMSLQKEIIDEIVAQDKSLPVKFDFAGVEYISSGFIRILMMVVRMKGKDFTIVNIRPAVKEILLLANLDQFITLS